MSVCYSCSIDVEYGIRVREYVFCSLNCFSKRFIRLADLKLVFSSL
jgi:hypothetical protein